MTYDIRTELQLSGTWTTITPGLVRAEQAVNIRRGRTSEGTVVDPASLNLTLENLDGRFTPGNPAGAYYGSIGRNTPIRVSLPYGSSYLQIPGDSDDRATAPDSAALSITGDIDVRVQADMHWCEDLYLAGKYTTSGNQRSWAVGLTTDGVITWTWSTAGTSATTSTVRSTSPLSTTAGPLAVRVTHDVDNGASGNDVKFYYSSDFSSWTQLGSTVTSSGTTSIYDSTASVEVGNVNDLAVSGSTVLWSQARKILRFELYSGIAGTVKANPRFDTATAGVASFADTAASANTWTMQGSTVIDDRAYRFTGEVSSWTPTSDVSGNDATTEVVAAGPLRRIQRKETPLRSAILRARRAQTTAPIAYWPCEEGTDASSFSSPVSGVLPMVWTGSPRLSSYDAFYGSDGVPEVNGSLWRGWVPTYTPGASVSVQFFVNIPSAGISDATEIMWVTTTGTVAYMVVTYATTGGGTLGFEAYADPPGLPIASSTGIAGVNGVPYMVSLVATTSGSDVNITCYGTPANQSDGAVQSTATGTATSYTLGRVTRVTLNQSGGMTGDGCAAGHISVHNEALTLSSDAPFRAGYAGETPGARIYRLCSEEGISFRSIGTLGFTSTNPESRTLMGPQRPGTLNGALTEAADTGGGLIYEPPDTLGIGYRTRSSLYNQSARVAANYASNELADPLEPVFDDQQIRNDVTVTRVDGSSARAIVATGPLSNQDPPNGAGVYDYAKTLNPQYDSQLGDLAGLVAHLGTIDEPRHENLAFHLTSNEVLANSALLAGLAGFDLGDRVTVSNPPSTWMIPDAFSQLAIGLQERINKFERTITMSTVPESGYRFVTLDDTVYGRADTSGSVLAASASSGATSITVTTTDGPIWTTDSADCPFDIRVAGEVMTASAVAPAGADAFTRTTSNGWGTADTGGAWTCSGGAAGDFSTTGSAGRITLPSVSSNHWTTLPVTCTDFDVYVTFSTSALATGGPIYAGLIARFADTSNYYVLRIACTTTQTVVLSIRETVAGVSAAISAADVTVSGLTHTAGGQIRARFQGDGTTLRGKAWLASGTEPDAWHITATDTSFTSGYCGTRTVLDAANTNVSPTVDYDDFSLVNPQAFTVTRSVNGATKAQTAGADVRLAYPTIIGL